jgi:hypothetical protein
LRTEKIMNRVRAVFPRAGDWFVKDVRSPGIGEGFRFRLPLSWHVARERPSITTTPVIWVPKTDKVARTHARSPPRRTGTIRMWKTSTRGIDVPSELSREPILEIFFQQPQPCAVPCPYRDFSWGCLESAYRFSTPILSPPWAPHGVRSSTRRTVTYSPGCPFTHVASGRKGSPDGAVGGGVPTTSWSPSLTRPARAESRVTQATRYERSRYGTGSTTKRRRRIQIGSLRPFNPPTLQPSNPPTLQPYNPIPQSHNPPNPG